jgi:ATP-binding cassette subfamily B protein
VAAGLFEQPVVVLSLLVLAGLSVAGALQVVQMGVVESIQLRVFANTALDLADRLVRVRMGSLRGEYAPELVNRFFDVLTIQKSLSKILLDAYSAILQAFVGLIVLAFYGPTLLAVDLFIVIAFVAGLFLLGIGGVRTSIEESREKYRVAEWLEDLARCHVSLKLHGGRNYLRERADRAVMAYLDARRDHFRVTIRQLGGYFFFAAVANAGGLAAGGWQVLNGTMTLGQLVAAQIIINLILAGMDKVVRKTAEFFDLLTGLDKVGHVTDLVEERSGGRLLLERPLNSGARVVCRSVRFGYQDEIPVLAGLDLELREGERVSLVGASGAGKSTLAALLCGLEEPSFGSVEVDGVDVRDVDLDSLRHAVSLVGYDRELFEGSIEENIRVGREHISPEEVRWAIEMVELTDEVSLMPGGLQMRVVSGGLNLSRGQVQRLLIARAIVDHPRLLILDEAFTGIDERIAGRILERIFDPANRWTIIDISHEPEVVLRTATVHVLTGGRIKESGVPEALARDEASEFSQLFPYLCARLRAVAGSEASGS